MKYIVVYYQSDNILPMIQLTHHPQTMNTLTTPGVKIVTVMGVKRNICIPISCHLAIKSVKSIRKYCLFFTNVNLIVALSLKK